MDKVATVLFANLLLAHLMADFPLQADSWVKNKQENAFSGYGMWVHSLVVFVCTWVAVGYLKYWWLAFVIALTHIIIDYIKVRWTKNGPVAFAVDQGLHIVSLVLCALLFCYYFPWNQYAITTDDSDIFYPILFCCYVFCLSPANYVIKEILKYCHVQDGGEEANDSVKRSGMLIGSAERFLVLTFIILGNFEAAGLTVAAKSLLRFNDDECPRTEYVLVGTLLSITVAVICAIVIIKFGMGHALIGWSAK